MIFVRLPKGTFSMGLNGKNKRTKRQIAADFEISLFNVKQGLLQAVVGNNPQLFCALS